MPSTLNPTRCQPSHGTKPRKTNDSHCRGNCLVFPLSSHLSRIEAKCIILVCPRPLHASAGFELNDACDRVQMKIEIDETRLELDQACAGRASAQRECALLNVQLEKTRAALEREREESYTRTRLLGARPSSSGSSVVKSHSLTVLRKEAIESIEAGRDDGIESETTARSRSPSGDLSTPTVSLALSAGQDLLEIGLSEKRRIEVCLCRGSSGLG